MTLNIELGPDEEKALLERARLSGRDPAHYVQELLRDHIRAALREGAEDAVSPRPAATLDDLIDREFVAYCEREADDTVTLDEVRASTSKFNHSMARVIIEEERADRF
jgi:hypothetical protein